MSGRAEPNIQNVDSMRFRNTILQTKFLDFVSIFHLLDFVAENIISKASISFEKGKSAGEI